MIKLYGEPDLWYDDIASLALPFLGDFMSEKRRDNRNRILREGEYQGTDERLNMLLESNEKGLSDHGE